VQKKLSVKIEKKQLNCWIPKSTYRELETRAAKLGLKASAYASLILNECSKSDMQGPTQIESELAKLKQTQPPSADKSTEASRSDKTGDTDSSG
jgi:hypothetical protein